MSFKVAISGLRAAQQELNVIGNNISNVGTTGFKSSRVEFEDVFTLGQLGASDNASGKGVNTSRVSQQFTQGNISFTDNNLDLAISGQGFFMVQGEGGDVQYTREGAFSIDRDSYVVNANNQRLKVFGADAQGNILGSVEDFRVDSANLAPTPTGAVEVGLNLNSQATIPANAFDPNDSLSYNNSTSTTIYDSLGGSYLAQNYYVRTGTNTWDAYTYLEGTQVANTSLTFSNAGALTGGSPVTTTAWNPPSGAAPLSFSIDYAATTQFGESFGVNSITQDGYPSGRLSGIDIDKEGVVFARYSNGQALVQGQVALANFANPQGLVAQGGNAWTAGFSAGDPVIGPPGSASLGLVQSGALEDSNVDLSKELVALIVAQRNFQANTEVISTNDAITQSVINIR